jgi:hypothetical protein
MERRSYSSTLSVRYSHFHDKRTISRCTFFWLCVFLSLKPPQWKEVTFIQGVYWNNCGSCRGLQWYCSDFNREINAANHKYLRQWLRVFIRTLNPTCMHLKKTNVCQSLHRLMCSALSLRTYTLVTAWRNSRQRSCSYVFKIKLLIGRRERSPYRVAQCSRLSQYVHQRRFSTCLVTEPFKHRQQTADPTTM